MTDEQIAALLQMGMESTRALKGIRADLHAINKTLEAIDDTLDSVTALAGEVEIMREILGRCRPTR